MSKLLLYCTKAKKQKDLLWSNNLKHFFLDGAYNRLIDNLPEYLLNGKIVAECDFEVEEITYAPNPSAFERANFSPKEWCYDYQEKYGGLSNEELLKHSCLTNEELSDYLNTHTNDKKVFCKDTFGYAIHIKNLHIFDKPYELGKTLIYNFNTQYIVEKAPQNMMKVYNRAGECHILISIQPQWMCLILNRIKDVEVRKVVLKEMLENE